MADQILAQNKLLEEGYSCVLAKDGHIIMTSYEKGIKPLFLELLKNKDGIQNASMADKVVGKALALLSLYAQIKSVYGCIISDYAKVILESNGVTVKYGEIVPYIMNSDETDNCPMEKLVTNIDDPEEAFKEIKKFFSKTNV